MPGLGGMSHPGVPLHTRQMPDTYTPEQLAAFARFSPHLHAMESDEGLRRQLRAIEDKEALLFALQDRATTLSIDSAEHPSDFDKFITALTVAREESAATIELETLRVAYITEALEVGKRAHNNASLVPA